MTATYDEQTELWTVTEEGAGVTVRGPLRAECERRVRELLLRIREEELLRNPAATEPHTA